MERTSDAARAHTPGTKSKSTEGDEPHTGGAVGALQALMAAGGNQAMVQLAAAGSAGSGGPPGVRAAAAEGVSDGGGPLPHGSAIQQAFGRHDVSGVKAHTGGAARQASEAIGAQAYATGEDVAFRDAPDLHTAAHEAAHVVQQRQGVTLGGGVGRVGDRYERQADEVADRVVRGESAEPLLDGAGGGATADRPVQRLALPGAAVQLTQYGDPSAAAIAKLMSDAGISNFGPYVWDDTNASAPMFKLSASFTGWTVEDCLNAPRYEPEDPSKTVAGEKGKSSLVASRRKKAMAAIFGSTQGVVDAILAHDGGKTPRAIASLAAEDGYSGGHTSERHILGAGKMVGHGEVAERAAFWYVGGVRMDLDDAGRASVFSSASGALTAVQAAVTSDLAANWATHRRSLAKNTQVKITVAATVPVVAYTKSDAPPGTPYPTTDRPKYMGGSGDRELYAGHYTGASSDPNAPDAKKAPLTAGGSATWGNVYVIVDPKSSAPGGWAIYTAYPKP